MTFALDGLPFVLDLISFVLDGLPFVLDLISFARDGLPFVLDLISFVQDGFPFVLDLISSALEGLPFVLARMLFALDLLPFFTFGDRAPGERCPRFLFNMPPHREASEGVSPGAPKRSVTRYRPSPARPARDHGPGPRSQRRAALCCAHVEDSSQ